MTSPWVFRLLLGGVALGATAAGRAAEFPRAAQPQLAANAGGQIWVAYGHGQEIFVARSDDRGATFAPPVRVAALPSLMLGRRRGPRIGAHGDRVTITAMAGDCFAFTSKDAGKTWAGPARVNDVPRRAREGLNGLAVAPDGRVFATWLDLRGERTQLYGAASTDGVIFHARPGSPEERIARGTQSGAAATPKRTVAVWQQGADLWTTAIGVTSAPRLLASKGRFPTLIALPGGDHLLLAYEHGPDAVVERF